MVGCAKGNITPAKGPVCQNYHQLNNYDIDVFGLDKNVTTTAMTLRLVRAHLVGG